VHIEPRSKQVQEQLPVDQIGTLSAAIQIRAQNAVDSFSGTTGSHRSFEDVQEFFCYYLTKLRLKPTSWQ
jgi:hypothetical protein